MALMENELWDMNAMQQGKRLPLPIHQQRARIKRIERMVEDWDARIRVARPHCRQVQHLIEKFGGILPFAVAVNRHPNHIIYRWLGVTKAGKLHKRTWGLIPSMGILLRLVQVSRAYGVVLTPEDLFPDMIEDGVVKNPYENAEFADWVRSIRPNEQQQKLETELAMLIQG